MPIHMDIFLTNSRFLLPWVEDMIEYIGDGSCDFDSDVQICSKPLIPQRLGRFFLSLKGLKSRDSANFLRSFTTTLQSSPLRHSTTNTTKGTKYIKSWFSRMPINVDTIYKSWGSSFTRGGIYSRYPFAIQLINYTPRTTEYRTFQIAHDAWPLAFSNFYTSKGYSRTNLKGTRRGNISSNSSTTSAHCLENRFRFPERL